MSNAQQTSEGSGWGSCVGALVLIALVVGALISLAALVDPFSWMPPVGEVWAECADDWSTERDECALEHRFPGFWWHALVNLVYTAVALGLGLVFAGGVSELRTKRVARFSSVAAMADFREARQVCLGVGVTLAAVALVPIVAAVV